MVARGRHRSVTGWVIPGWVIRNRLLPGSRRFRWWVRWRRRRGRRPCLAALGRLAPAAVLGQESPGWRRCVGAERTWRRFCSLPCRSPPSTKARGSAWTQRGVRRSRDVRLVGASGESPGL